LINREDKESDEGGWSAGKEKEDERKKKKNQPKVEREGHRYQNRSHLFGQQKVQKNGRKIILIIGSEFQSLILFLMVA